MSVEQAGRAGRAARDVGRLLARVAELDELADAERARSAELLAAFRRERLDLARTIRAAQDGV